MVRPGRFGAVTKPPGPGCRLRGSAVVRPNPESRIPNPGFRGNAMALNLTQKQEVVAELAEVAGSAQSLVAAEYVGLTVAQLTDLRKKARQEGVFLKRSEEHTSELQSLMRTSYAVFCLK